MPAPAPFYGRLARNGRLDGAELVWNGPFEGAESIAYRGDEAYTGVIGGYIIRIDKNGSWEKIVQTGTPCGTHINYDHKNLVHMHCCRLFLLSK